MRNPREPGEIALKRLTALIGESRRLTDSERETQLIFIRDDLEFHCKRKYLRRTDEVPSI